MFSTNLFMILPKGVVSKKVMGACKMVSSNFKCRFLDAITHPYAAAINTTMIESAENIKKVNILVTEYIQYVVY